MKVPRTGCAASRLLAAAAIACALQATALASPALAGEHRVVSMAAHATDAAAAPAADWKDDAIRRAFRDVLDREPTGSELRDYRQRIDRDRWTEADIRDDLRTRDRERRDRDRSFDQREVDRIIYLAYDQILHREPDPEGLRTYRREMLQNGWTEAEVRRALRSSGERDAIRLERTERTIRRIYQEVLHREPDAEGMRNYRREMLQNGWTAEDVRKALRTSAERDTLKQQAAERTIRRLYQELLGRDPDDRGMGLYRNRMVFEGWSEQQVREALTSSPEYRDRNRMTRDKAVDIVKRAYREVLNRDPDRDGLEGYVGKILRDGWTQADVARELRNSDEYRQRRR